MGESVVAGTKLVDSPRLTVEGKPKGGRGARPFFTFVPVNSPPLASDGD